MKESVKIFLGGVPFGRDNAGDEAILECVVKTLRDIRPDAQITVSTGDPAATAARLGVATVPLFGFAPPYSRTQRNRLLAGSDLFIWPGATGLSDYPEIPLEMLRIARRSGTRTVVWGAGMNSELNPFLYKLQPGRRRMLLTALSPGRIDLVRQVESRTAARARRRIAEGLRAADLVVLRDPETLQAVQACGPVPGALVGADPAILLEPAEQATVDLNPAARALLESAGPKLGVCISAQRPLAQRDELVRFLDRMIAEERCAIVFLPMNPRTDAALMDDLRGKMQHRDRAVVIHGRRAPAEIMAIAGRLDVVVSSRLHLLILAANQHVPMVGIGRGSKVDSFLAPYGLKPAGSVDECDFVLLGSEVRRLLAQRAGFETTSRRVRAELLRRMDAARIRLAEVVDGIA